MSSRRMRSKYNAILYSSQMNYRATESHRNEFYRDNVEGRRKEKEMEERKEKKNKKRRRKLKRYT